MKIVAEAEYNNNNLSRTNSQKHLQKVTTPPREW
jgi:hypothetical protein